MKKQYNQPTVTFVCIPTNDIVTASYEEIPSSGCSVMPYAPERFDDDEEETEE